MTATAQVITQEETDQLQVLGLTEADLPEIERVAGSIQSSNPLSVAEFGRDVSEHTAAYSDELLAQVRNRDLEEAGTKLTKVITTARTLNLSALSDKRSRLPVIGPLVDRIKGRSNNFMAEFESTSAQMERLVNEVAQTQDGLRSRIDALESMFGSVRQEHRMLGIHIAAGKRRIAELRAEAEHLRQNLSNDPTKAQDLSDMEALISNLDKRIGDLVALQQAALQSLPTIRIIQANNQMLVDKYHTIQQIALPAWKKQFTLRLTLNEQRNAVELADNIDNATNELLVNNAKLLHKNSVETAKANQRLVIDVETLQAVQNTLIHTVQDVIRIQSEGVSNRQQAEKQILGMREDLSRRLSRTGVNQKVLH